VSRCIIIDIKLGKKSESAALCSACRREYALKSHSEPKALRQTSPWESILDGINTQIRGFPLQQQRQNRPVFDAEPPPLVVSRKLLYIRLREHRPSSTRDGGNHDSREFIEYNRMAKKLLYIILPLKLNGQSHHT